MYEHDLNQIRTHGTHRSPPYTRLMRAISNLDLLLERDRVKERNSGLRNESSKTKRTGLFLYRYRLLRWFWNSRKEAFKGCALTPIPGEFWKRQIWYKNRLYGLFLIYRYLLDKKKRNEEMVGSSKDMSFLPVF